MKEKACVAGSALKTVMIQCQGSRMRVQNDRS